MSAPSKSGSRRLRPCEKLLACAEGDPELQPTCPKGQANAGTTGRCFTLCADDRPCSQGVCTAWQGGRVCM